MGEKFEKMPIPKQGLGREETIEEMIERVRIKSEEVGGVPQIKADLFGGETSDEIVPKKKKRKEVGIARAQRNLGPRNERRRGNIRLEKMIPPGDR